MEYGPVLVVALLVVSTSGLVVRHDIINVSRPEVEVGAVLPLKAPIPRPFTFHEVPVGISLALKDIAANPALFPSHNLTVRLTPAVNDDVDLFSVLKLTDYNSEISVNHSQGVPLLLLGGEDGAAAGAGIVGRTTLSAWGSAPHRLDPLRFPTLSRLLPSTESVARDFIGVVCHFGWRFVGVIYDGVNADLAERISEVAVANNVTILSQQKVEATSSSAYTALNAVRSSTAHIILCLLSRYPNTAGALWPEALQLGMLSPVFAWVMTPIALMEALSIGGEVRAMSNNMLAIRSGPFDIFSPPAQSFTNRLLDELVLPVDVTREQAARLIAPEMSFSVYAALMGAAEALNSFVVLKLRCAADGSAPECVQLHTRGEDAELLRLVRNASYLSACFEYNSSMLTAIGEPTTWSTLHQSRGSMATSASSVNVLGMVHADTRTVQLAVAPSFYGSDQPPKDRPVQIFEEIDIPLATRTAVAGATVICALCALGGIWLNHKHADDPVMRMSSPRLNVVALWGILLWLVSVPLLSTGRSVSRCQADIALLTFGSTIFYGSLFAKVYRVHVIFNNNQWQKPRGVHDHHMLAIVVLLLLVDLTILLTWFVWDGIVVESKVVEVMRSSDTIVNKTVSKCTSPHWLTFRLVTIGVRALVLVFGSWLTYQIRNVKLKVVLNDAKIVGLIIYLASIINICLIPFMAALERKQVEELFVLLSLFVLLQSFTSTLLLVGPQYHRIKAAQWEHGKRGGLNGRAQSSRSSTSSSGSSSSGDDAARLARQMAVADYYAANMARNGVVLAGASSVPVPVAGSSSLVGTGGQGRFPAGHFRGPPHPAFQGSFRLVACEDESAGSASASESNAQDVQYDAQAFNPGMPLQRASSSNMPLRGGATTVSMPASSSNQSMSISAAAARRNWAGQPPKHVRATRAWPHRQGPNRTTGSGGDTGQSGANGDHPHRTEVVFVHRRLPGSSRHGRQQRRDQNPSFRRRSREKRMYHWEARSSVLAPLSEDSGLNGPVRAHPPSSERHLRPHPPRRRGRTLDNDDDDGLHANKTFPSLPGGVPSMYYRRRRGMGRRKRLSMPLRRRGGGDRGGMTYEHGTLAQPRRHQPHRSLSVPLGPLSSRGGDASTLVTPSRSPSSAALTAATSLTMGRRGGGGTEVADIAAAVSTEHTQHAPPSRRSTESLPQSSSSGSSRHSLQTSSTSGSLPLPTHSSGMRNARDRLPIGGRLLRGLPVASTTAKMHSATPSASTSNQSTPTTTSEVSGPSSDQPTKTPDSGAAAAAGAQVTLTSGVSPLSTEQ